MTVKDLIRLLEQQNPEMNVAVGTYKGPHNPVGWNETHERSHGPIWVGIHDDRCFIGINCYDKSAFESYRTIKDGTIVTVDQYYNRDTPPST